MLIAANNFFYKNIARNRYQYIVKMFGRHTVITGQKKIEFSFDESFGYFFTCYACGYADTSDGITVQLRGITVKYSKGK